MSEKKLHDTLPPHQARLEADLLEVARLVEGGLTVRQAIDELRRRVRRDAEQELEALRDLFAGIALHSVLQRLDLEGGYIGTTAAAKAAYEAAESMIAARSR